MAAALATRLRSESRTSFGAPVDPDVLRSRRRSGWRSRVSGAWRSISMPAVDVVTTAAGRHAAANAVEVGAGEQRDVPRFQQGEVGDDELDGVRGAEHDDRPAGQGQLGDPLGDETAQRAVGHGAVAVDERDGVGRAGGQQRGRDAPCLPRQHRDRG